MNHAPTPATVTTFPAPDRAETRSDVQIVPRGLYEATREFRAIAGSMFDHLQHESTPTARRLCRAYLEAVRSERRVIGKENERG